MNLAVIGAEWEPFGASWGHPFREVYEKNLSTDFTFFLRHHVVGTFSRYKPEATQVGPPVTARKCNMLFWENILNTEIPKKIKVGTF